MAKPLRIKVTDRDRGWKDLQKQIRGSSRQHATAGIHGDENSRSESGLGNVGLMAVHEFGSSTAGIPERSVIRKTVDDKIEDYRKALRILGGRIYADGMPVRQALDIAGTKMASDMRRTIDRQPGDWPTLKPATVARKASAKKLVDLRELLKSFKHKVVG